MNRMNYLAQLALMLHGNGMGSQYDAGDDQYGATPSDWPAGYGSVPGSDLPVTPAQEFMLGTSPLEVFGARPMAIPRPAPFPFPGEWSDPIPRWNPFPLPRAIPLRPPAPIPDDVPFPPPYIPRKKRRDNMFGFPDGSTETPTFPPYNPPFPIPDAAPGGGSVLPPITTPNFPHNPPFEIPKPGIWGDSNRLESDEPVSEIPEEEECEEEWNDAFKRCNEEFIKLRKKRSGEHLWFNLDRCAKKFVSERCGGNAVDWGPKGKPPATDEPDTSGFIQA